jgi:hypothetical protein
MWNDRLDAKLLKLKQEGLSFAEVGKQIAVTRSAAIGRFQRLKGRVFPSQAARRRTRKATAKRKAAALARKNTNGLRKLRAAIAAGTQRNKAIKQAFTAGASCRAIGDVLGLTGQRIRQIVMQLDVLK